MPHLFRWISLLAALALTATLSGCATFGFPFFGLFASDKECLMRAMYFESNRSSEDGMMAVGTVVMNRVASPGFPKSVCGVVLQSGQFTSNIVWGSTMRGRGAALASDAADRILRGERHAGVGAAQYFHTAGLTFPYDNMHYTTVAGGNAFYERW